MIDVKERLPEAYSLCLCKTKDEKYLLATYDVKGLIDGVPRWGSPFCDEITHWIYCKDA